MKQQRTYRHYGKRAQPSLGMQMFVEIVFSILILPLTILGLVFGGIGLGAGYKKYRNRRVRFGNHRPRRSVYSRRR